MPINTSLMESLMKEYGMEKGKSVYYAMEMKKKKSKKRKK